ncbi:MULTISPECIES: phage tail protein [Streptobacillus]|uniref:phage tail protein n=1 Tax=Streptobacillus TaxID=34104 RepID=UPI0007E380C0|nr:MULTISPECIES: phage tail protein [Streptobacillus]
MIKLEYDVESTVKEFEKAPKELKKAISFAINRTLVMVKTRQLKSATDEYSVKRKDLSKNLNLKKSTTSTLNGVINVVGSPLGLDHFKLVPRFRSKNKVVRAAVKRGATKVLPNAFIAYHNGFLGAFSRVGKSSLPIKRLKGPSAPQMLGGSTIIEKLQGFAESKLKERLEHEIRRLIK